MYRLARMLKVNPGEGRTAALLLGLMLLASTGGSIGGNAIEALLFARLGVQVLPYLYMALAAVTFVTSLAFTALLGRIARERLYTQLPLVLAALIVVERALLALDDPAVYIVLWLTLNVAVTLLTLATWGAAGLRLDTRQAKRLFPLFGAARILGAVAGGLLTQPMAAWLHAENLLLVWSATMVASFVIARALLGSTRGARVTTARPQAGFLEEMQQGYQIARNSALMRWMSFAAILFSVLYFSLALPFSRAAAQQFPGADALAGFLGLFQALSTVVAFLASLLLANRLFARLGVTGTIFAFTASYLLGFGALTLYSAFGVLVAFRFLQMAMLSGIADPAYQAMFNVVPPERRDQVRAFVDGVPGQAGTFVAGLVLVVGEQALAPQQLYLIGFAAAALALYLVWRAHRAYGQALVAALRTGQPRVFFDESAPFGALERDAGAAAAAEQGLHDGDPGVRRVAAEIMAHLSAPAATRLLVECLQDRDALVRASALRGLARSGASAALLEVAACLDDEDQATRLQAVHALARLAPYSQGLSAHLRPLLRDASAEIRATAAAALLRNSTDREARQVLLTMMASGTAPARSAAMHALVQTRELQNGNGSPDPASDRVIARLVETNLADEHPEVRRAAVAALAIQPEPALDRLTQALADADAAVRSEVARALGQIGAPAVRPVVDALGDARLEEGALQALMRLPLRDAPQDVRGPAHEYALANAARALHYHQLSGAFAGDRDGAARLLSDSLEYAANAHARKALRAASVLGRREAIQVALEGLDSRVPGQRANAIETLQSSVEAAVMMPLLRLWEGEPDKARRARGAGWAQPQLHDVLSDPDAWLRACAALVAGGSPRREFRLVLSELAQTDPDALVRSTAGAAAGMRRLAQGEIAVQTLPTLSLMERILFLRRVPLFAELPPSDLQHVADAASERLHADGEFLARQGEPGDELYIVVSGEVRVLASPDGGPAVELARRARGECVGEMSLILDEPRIASLLASGETRTLCIERRRFSSILRERPEIALGVMRVLCTRLKESQASARADAALRPI